MRIAVCDDEKQICEWLKKKILQFFFEDKEEIRVDLYENGEQLLQSDLSQIEVLFLDMDMPGRNGLETAKEIRKYQDQMLIVFVTAHSGFVYESFRVAAFRYLLKPIKEKDLEETLQSLRKVLCATDKELKISFENEIYRIRYSDIIYIEGMRGKLWIHCSNHTYRWRGVLKTVAETLKDRGFFQIHQSYIINLNRIQSYSKKEIQLEGGFTVPVSRYKWDAFQEEYISYWSESV